MCVVASFVFCFFFRFCWCWKVPAAKSSVSLAAQFFLRIFGPYQFYTNSTMSPRLTQAPHRKLGGWFDLANEMILLLNLPLYKPFIKHTESLSFRATCPFGCARLLIFTGVSKRVRLRLYVCMWLCTHSRYTYTHHTHHVIVKWPSK